MEIKFTKKQYKTLLMMLYCGEWVLNSYKLKPDNIQKETEEVEQLIFSFAKEAGLEKWIENDPDMGQSFSTALMEENLHKFLDIYHEKMLG